MTFKNPEVIKQIEKQCPQMAQEFQNICNEMYETFCHKQMNYGPGNIMLGGSVDNPEDVRIALMGLAIRMNDKANRLIQLAVKGTPDLVGESISDTFLDMSVYGIIAQIVSRGKWAK